MIAKGTTHNNGAKLASYMTTGKHGERAELWQLRGFEATNIKDGFRDVHIMADATKCEQPFFHVQVRNREGETLTREQWEFAADRIERMLGLAGQPRAVAFHTYEHNNDEHMHVAWSRIDQDTLTAKPLPFFKERLKKISRELELHFALEPVTNKRKGPIKYAPKRAEEEQARRVGVDIHEVRNAIRDCWDRSDCGISFQAALDHEGLTLAKGDRRNLVVIDQGGGIHALSKRILDVTATKIRARLSDLDVNQLPGVEQARAPGPGASRHRQGEQPQMLDTLQGELTEVQKLLADAAGTQRLQPKAASIWDRDRADAIWQDAVMNAAIEREKVERQFVEPKERETQKEQRHAGAGSRKREWPVRPPTQEPIKSSPEYHIKDGAREAARDRNYTPPKELKGMSARIMTIVQTLRNDPEQIPTKVKNLSAVLDDEGIALAKVTKEEADRSHREAEFAKSVGNYAPRYKEGEIVAVTEPRLEYRRNGEITRPAPRVHKLDQPSAEIFIEALDRPSRLQGIDATTQALNQRAQERAEMRMANATNIKDNFSRSIGKAKGPGTAALKVGAGIGSGLIAFTDAIASLFSPTLTPQQLRDGEHAKQRREAEAETGIDFSRYTAEVAQRRQQQDNELEAARQRERDRGGRER